MLGGRSMRSFSNSVSHRGWQAAGLYIKINNHPLKGSSSTGTGDIMNDADHC
jgi:hypothetical protein